MAVSGGAPELTPEDLAGLSPQDVSRAFAGALNYEELVTKQKQLEEGKVDRLIDRIYKTALTEQAIASARKPPKDERTALQKNYEYAKSLGYKGTVEDFGKDTRTTHEKDYERYKAEGGDMSFHDWLRDMTALGGGLSLEEYGKRREVSADIESKKYFTDPKGLAQDVDKYINTDEVQNQLIQFADDPRQREIETVRAREKYITGKIAAAGGSIVNAELDGRTFVFTVKWPDGKTSEVRYVN